MVSAGWSAQWGGEDGVRIRTQRVARGIQWRLFPSCVEEGFLAVTEEQLPPCKRGSLFFFDDYNEVLWLPL
jgi:hypothetical protein